LAHCLGTTRPSHSTRLETISIFYLIPSSSYGGLHALYDISLFFLLLVYRQFVCLSVCLLLFFRYHDLYPPLFHARCISLSREAATQRPLRFTSLYQFFLIHLRRTPFWFFFFWKVPPFFTPTKAPVGSTFRPASLCHTFFSIPFSLYIRNPPSYLPSPHNAQTYIHPPPWPIFFSCLC
jgi:hypothetical protein